MLIYPIKCRRFRQRKNDAGTGERIDTKINIIG